jgi:Tfp pilus assembly protein PilF
MMKETSRLILFAALLAVSLQVTFAQPDYTALNAEAEKALADAFIPQGQPFALAIKTVQEKRLFRFYEVAKNHSLSQTFDKFYAPATPIDANAKPDELLAAARNLSKLGYAAESDKYFDLYLKKDKKAQSFTIYQRAENAMLSENYKSCIDLINKAYKTNDADAKFWKNSYNYALAICSANLGDDKTAAVAFNTVNQHLKSSFPYRLFQDGAYKCKGTAADNYATAAYNQLKGNTYEAYRDAFIAVKCDPNHLPSLEILYKIENDADGKTDSLHNWASHRKMKMLRLQNKPIPSPFGMSADERNEFFQYFLAVGLEAYDKNDFEWAMIYANEAVVAFPDRPEGYILRGRALYSQSVRPSLKLAAWLDAGKALQLDPNNGLAYNIRGLVLLNLKRDPSAAIAEFSKGIAVAPNEFRLSLNRGLVYLNQLDFKLAYADFERSGKLNPLDFNSFTNKAMAALELKDFANAVAALETALELNEKRNANSPDDLTAIADTARFIRRHLVIAYDATGSKISADVHHQFLLDNFFDHPDTKSLAARNPKLVADYANINSVRKQAETLKAENLQRKNSEEFLEIVKEETESEKSFNDTFKRKIDLAKATNMGEATLMGELILLFDGRINAAKARVSKLEPYLTGDRLSPANRKNAEIIVGKLKDLIKKYESEKSEAQKRLRDSRR